jgi:hypothetical protein
VDEEYWKTVNRKPDVEQEADSALSAGAGCLLVCLGVGVLLVACAFAARIVGS